MVRVIGILIISGCMHVQGAFSMQSDGVRRNDQLDIALGATSGKLSGAISFSRQHLIGKKKQRLKLGYGLRFTSFVASNAYFTTAPAKYTSPVQNLTTLFSETILANIDTITTGKTVTNSFNGAVYIQYRLAKRVEVGMNIDVIGFSFGPQKTFRVISSSYDPGQARTQKAAPTSFNLLLTSDNDIGSLNSEFYFTYWLSDKIGIRSGYTFLFSEFRTNQKLSFNDGDITNDRYRKKSGMLFAAITLRLFSKV